MNLNHARMPIPPQLRTAAHSTHVSCATLIIFEIARFNEENPYQTRAYLVLRAEALDESHPAHEYFAHRGQRLRKQVEQVPWKLPPEYSKPEQVGLLSMAIGSAMEGLESRWLGEPDIDFLQTWTAYEDILFPLPHWEGYR